MLNSSAYKARMATSSGGAGSLNRESFVLVLFQNWDKIKVG
jgi:hypothetical protein